MSMVIDYRMTVSLVLMRRSQSRTRRLPRRNKANDLSTTQRQDNTLEVISFGESAVADEGAGDAGEGEEVVGFAFV
ncbi:hypothetical protein ACFW9I_37080, partial [[Kitasatospora] papulosa]|uniref:hypothetical protein n=1 Tax=[Kitasatospora] papulosa TaxID=1464011 RepID=UPI0036B1AC0F